MPTFVYKAITPQGQVIKSKMDDASKLSCVKRLKRNGLTPISISQTITITRGKKDKGAGKTKKQFKPNFEATAVVGAKRGKKKRTFIEKIDKALASTEKITYRDIKIFSQNFYLLKKANFNNIHALSTVIETTENPKLKVILEDVLAGVESGEFMYTTMEYYDNIFPYIYINMVKVGELSGSLERSLQQGVKYLEDTDAVTKKLKRILLPNIAMFIGIIVMLFVAVIFGLPMLEGVFDKLGAEAQLPALTLWFADVVDVFLQFWYIPVGIIALIGLVFFLYIKTPRGRYNFDYFKYTMPIFGKLIYSLDFSRLMKATLLNLQNGMRIQDSLEVSKNVVKNTVMLSMIETSINNIFVGQSWIEPFEHTKLSNSMTTEMLKIGMQTDLTEMLEKLLEYMDQDIDNTMEKIMRVLPEVSYAIVGVVLIFFVIVVLVPCIQMYMGNFLFDAYLS